MNASTLYLILTAIGNAYIAGIVAALARRKRTITDELPNVVELAHELASLKKQVRRAYMQHVREGESGSALDPISVQTPPELQIAQPTPTASPQELKRHLRNTIFSKRKQ